MTTLKILRNLALAMLFLTWTPNSGAAQGDTCTPVFEVHCGGFNGWMCEECPADDGCTWYECEIGGWNLCCN